MSELKVFALHKNIKRQATDWGKIFANICDKELITQYDKPIKMSKRFEQRCLQRRHIDGKKVYIKILDIIRHQGNPN